MNQGSNEWSTTKGDQQNEQAHRNRFRRGRHRSRRHRGRGSKSLSGSEEERQDSRQGDQSIQDRRAFRWILSHQASDEVHCLQPPNKGVRPDDASRNNVMLSSSRKTPRAQLYQLGSFHISSSLVPRIPSGASLQIGQQKVALGGQGSGHYQQIKKPFLLL